MWGRSIYSYFRSKSTNFLLWFVLQFLISMIVKLKLILSCFLYYVAIHIVYGVLFVKLALDGESIITNISSNLSLFIDMLLLLPIVWLFWHYHFDFKSYWQYALLVCLIGRLVYPNFSVGFYAIDVPFISINLQKSLWSNFVMACASKMFQGTSPILLVITLSFVLLISIHRKKF